MRRMLMVVLVVAACGAAWAVDLNLPPGKWWERPAVVERLKLVEEQQDRIHGLVYEHSLRMIDLKADLDREELKLRNSVEQDRLDAEQVRAAFTAFQGARGKLEMERFELLLSIRQVLTSEQWQELQSLHRDMKRMRQEGGARGDRRRQVPGQRPDNGERPG